MTGENFPRIVAQSDLVRRWNYTRQGLALLIKRDWAFPKPVAEVNDGKTRIWQLADIEEYERTRPWLFDLEAKQRRQVWYFRRYLEGEGLI